MMARKQPNDDADFIKSSECNSLMPNITSLIIKNYPHHTLTLTPFQADQTYTLRLHFAFGVLALL